MRPTTCAELILVADLIDHHSKYLVEVATSIRLSVHLGFTAQDVLAFYMSRE